MLWIDWSLVGPLRIRWSKYGNSHQHTPEKHHSTSEGPRGKVWFGMLVLGRQISKSICVLGYRNMEWISLVVTWHASVTFKTQKGRVLKNRGKKQKNIQPTVAWHPLHQLPTRDECTFSHTYMNACGFLFVYFLNMTHTPMFFWTQHLQVWQPFHASVCAGTSTKANIILLNEVLIRWTPEPNLI